MPCDELALGYAAELNFRVVRRCGGITLSTGTNAVVTLLQNTPSHLLVPDIPKETGENLYFLQTIDHTL